MGTFLTETAHMANVISRQHQPAYCTPMQICLKYQTTSHPRHIFFWGCMTPILNRHDDITNSIYVWQWCYPVPLRQLLVQREREGSERHITSQMLIFSWLVWAQRTRADELRTEFLTQWCQTRDCDVQLTQVNSIAPAGNMQTQTQTDCYQACVAISVFGSAANPKNTFVLHCFIKEAFGEMAYGIYWNCWNIWEMAVLFSYQFWNNTELFNSDKPYYCSNL